MRDRFAALIGGSDGDGIDALIAALRPTVIKIDRESKFSGMVDIIDELDLAGLSRFSLGTLTPEEKKEVEAL